MIPRGATDARLRLYLPENAFPSYRVTLSTEDGNEVFSKNGLKPRADKAGDFVIVNLPVSKLRTGDNVLALSGISPTGQVELFGKSLIKVRRRKPSKQTIRVHLPFALARHSLNLKGAWFALWPISTAAGV